jgi:hypothetical protein
MFTNAPQRIPPLFKEIIDTHAQIAACDLSTLEGWRQRKALRGRMADLRRAAEEALRWNHNKGNTA